MERFLTRCTDGRVLLVTDGTEQSVFAIGERSVDEVRSALAADKALVVPMLVLEADVLRAPSAPANTHGYQGRSLGV